MRKGGRFALPFFIRSRLAAFGVRVLRLLRRGELLPAGHVVVGRGVLAAGRLVARPPVLRVAVGGSPGVVRLVHVASPFAWSWSAGVAPGVSSAAGTRSGGGAPPVGQPATSPRTPPPRTSSAGFRMGASRSGA